MRWFAVSAILLGVLLALFAYPRRAGAHALLVRSQPANGSIVATAPSVVRLWFDEEISPTLSSARLVDRNGAPIPATNSTAAATDPKLLEMQEPGLAPGTYGVLWQVLAKDDGHTSSGTVVFSVGSSNGPLAAATSGGTSSTPLDVTRRWIGLSLLAGVIGGLAVAGLVLGRIRQREPVELASTVHTARRRILAVVASCAALGAAVGVTDAVEEARSLSTPGRPWTSAIDDLILSTRWGHLWLVREAALLLLVPVVLMIRARIWHRRTLVRAAAALVVALVSAEALNSHAATVSSSRSTAVLSDAVHILAACVWLGAIPALALILVPRRGDDRVGTVALVRACAGPFSRVVAASVALVLATGLYNAGREVQSVGDLFSTSYGRALLVKSGLLILMVAVGLVNASRLAGTGRAGRLAPSLSRRLVAVEAVIGAALLVAVAVLVNTAPARGPAQVVDAAGRTGSASVADLSVTVSISPNHPGVNGFTVLAASSRRPPPAPIDAVALELIDDRGRTLVPLVPTATGTFFGTGRLGTDGEPQLRALVRRGATEQAVSIRWEVERAPELRAAPGRRLAPYVDVLAILVITMFLGAAWIVRRRWGSTEPAPPPAEPKIDSLV